MAKKSAAMACVLAAVEVAKKSRPNKTWTKWLPQHGREEMEGIRREWREGSLQGAPMSAVFHGIVAACKENSWPAPKSETTINRWLRSSDT
jgi:hypothetical protein